METVPATRFGADADSTAHTLPTTGVIVVAGGRGERLGAEVPKAFSRLRGRVLVEFSLAVITSLPLRGHLVLVVPESHAREALEIIEQVIPDHSMWEITVVPGGRERHESVRFGLDALPETIDTVLVHDAARPFASSSLFERVITAVRETGDAVIPGLPVTDTLKRTDEDGRVHETVARDALIRAQTPQGFPYELLVAAHADAERYSPPPTDDAELVQRAGGTVRTIAGELRAHKLTTPDDLEILDYFLTATAAGIGDA